MWQKGDPGWRSGRGQGENALLQARQQVLGVNGDCAHEGLGPGPGLGRGQPTGSWGPAQGGPGGSRRFPPQEPWAHRGLPPTPHGPCAKTSALVIYVSTHRVQQHQKEVVILALAAAAAAAAILLGAASRAESSLGYSHLCVLEAPLEPPPRRRRKPAPCRGPQHIAERGKKKNVHCAETGPIRYENVFNAAVI